MLPQIGDGCYNVSLTNSLMESLSEVYLLKYRNVCITVMP